jgi:hypothetical protein
MCDVGREPQVEQALPLLLHEAGAPCSATWQVQPGGGATRAALLGTPRPANPAPWGVDAQPTWAAAAACATPVPMGRCTFWMCSVACARAAAAAFQAASKLAKAPHPLWALCQQQEVMGGDQGSQVVRRLSTKGVGHGVGQ